MSVPPRTLAERASVEITPLRAVKLAELECLLPAGTLRACRIRDR